MNCNTNSLNPYIPSPTNPWDSKKVTHLYKRLTTGISPSIVKESLDKTPNEVIDHLFDEAISVMTTELPDWADKSKKEFEEEIALANDPDGPEDFDDVNRENMKEWQLQFFQDLRALDVRDDLGELKINKLRDRLVLFWSNHFVTEKNTYNCGRYMVKYYETLQKFALGNFKDFVHDIGLTDAMLAYLNGFENTKEKPNENYARELFELFTLGEENEDIEYTQQDILETSRAFTGYNDRIECEEGECKCQPIVYNADKFDTGIKTIFGQTGNWNYSDAIDILFNQKAILIARFIMTKLYRFFVSPEINVEVVNALAQDLLDAGFELIPPLKKLFKSEHFFSDEAIGTLIKSPIDYYINFLNVTSFPLRLDNGAMAMTDDEEVNDLTQFTFNNARNTGQELFQPVDVAGWQGDYDWINTSSLTIRWESLGNILWQSQNEKRGGDSEVYRTFAKELKPFITVSESDGNAYADDLARNIIHIFIPQGLTTATDYDTLITIFKEGGETQPQYYTDGTWNLDYYLGVPDQVYKLLLALIRIPEFQLN